MKKNKLLLVLLLLCSVFLMAGCGLFGDDPTPDPTPSVDYDAVLEDALSKVKISGVATTANRDFTVPLELKHKYDNVEYTITLSWTSSNVTVISLNGANATVTRPSDGDAKVTLTCTLSLEGKTKTKEFNLDVYKAEKTAEEILSEAEVELNAKVNTLGIDALTANVTLPTAAGLASVSWVSEDISICTSAGEINRPIYGEGDASVKLTATLSSGGVTKDVVYTFVIKEQARPADSEIPALAATYLKLNTENVTSNLTLPTMDEKFGTTISWVSSNPAVIATDGTVTQPAAKTGESVVVKLTATIKYGEYSTTKVFNVSVPELEPANNQEKASVAFNALGIDLAVVSASELVLPVEGLYDLSFSYVSDNANVVVEGQNVAITRTSEDYLVTLTAKTNIDGNDYSFDFAFVVKSTSKGSGTVEDPFVVETAADLAKIGTSVDGWNLDSHYVLYADIDLSEVANWTPIGLYKDGTTSINTPFTGSFNGNGYTISNLTSNSNYDGAGLFGYVRKAEIKNLYIDNANVTGLSKVGAFAGMVYGSKISNIFLSNSNVVATFAGDAYTGGLIGRAENILPSETEEGANLYIQYVSVVNTTVTGQYHNGGLIGGMRNVIATNDDDTIHSFVSDAYVEATVIACRRSGGVFGSLTGKVENVISNCTIKLQPDPIGTYNIIGLFVGNVAFNSSLTPRTIINNVMFTGDISEFIEKHEGRVATFVGSNELTNNRLTYENIYMDHDLYNKNGTGENTGGVEGKQITHENSLLSDWYLLNLSSFDFDKVWKLTEGKLPVLQYQNDNSAEEVVMDLLLNLPAETTENLTLVTDTNVRGIVVSWASDNAAIATDGTVTRPAYVDGDVEVTLTATYSINGKDYEKTFSVVVKCEDPTEDEMFATVKAEIDAALGEAREITESLVLPVSGAHNALISWASNNAAIASDGTVTRPVSGQPNAEVELVATVSFGETSRDFTYNYVVVAWPSTDLAIETVYNALELPESTTESLTLLTSQDANNLTVNISWSSNNAAIGTDGTVVRPQYADGDATVTLIATLSCEGSSRTKEFTIVVPKLEPTDADLVAEAKTAISALDVAVLSKDVVLPELNDKVSVSAEATDYVSVVEGTLVVTQPSYETGDKDYTITLTISCGEATDTLVLSGKVSKNMGDGSEANPYIIDSLEILESIGSEDTNHWILKADIDMSQKYNAESGKSWTPISKFNGVFDGNGFTISGLYINNTSTEQGLFGAINSCTIKNLTITNANITVAGTSGILAGKVNKNTTVLIENIRVEGKLEGSNKDSVIGGIIGCIDSRTDAGKSSNVTVNNCYADADIIGNRHNGGAFGQVKMSDRTYSIAISNIEVHGSILGIQSNGSLIGTVERTSSATAEGNEKYLTIKNVVTYNTISVNPTNTYADAYQNNCGVVGQITDGNKVLTVNFENVIIYQLGDYESFTAGVRGSFVGRAKDLTTVSLSNCYVNGTPFGYDGSASLNDGQGVRYGTQLSENSEFEFYTNLGFSEDIWKMGENGIVLK